jgi:heptosyltransferase III
VSTRAGRILVIRGGAIGDFILTLPVLAALRRHLPQARIEVLGYTQVTPLALAGGLADEVRSIEARPLAGFFARNGDLTPELQEYFAGFAVIISYLYDPDQIFQANVARCSRAQFIVGPHRPDESAALHATEVLLKPLERLAIFDADPVPRLSIDSRSSTLHPLALHPGSGSEHKNWPEPKWAELLQILVGSMTQTFLIVGGEAEGDRLERLASGVPAARVRIGRHLPLVELARLLTRCSAFVGHDSGISHLAAALGRPVLALWKESSEAVWRPRGEQVRIVRLQPGREASAIEVVGELEKLLS